MAYSILGRGPMDHDKWTPDETSQDKWTAVDRYFSEQLSLSDPALDAALAANKAAELPAIDGASGRRAKHSGNRHARWLQFHLARSRLARRWPAYHSRIQSQTCRSRACQHRARESRGHRRHSCRRGAR